MEREIRSYVLRKGRITTLQRRSIERLASTYCVPYAERQLCFAELFGRESDVIVEIGFGMGSETAEIAECRPDRSFLGIEVFQPGVGKLLSEIERRALANVRIVSHDAVDVFRHMIPDASLAGVHLFFPDPWPKKRHHKRRLVQPAFAELIAGKLAAGGYLYAVTDWEDYARQMLEVLSAIDALEGPSAGFADRRPWRPATKFEERGRREGRPIRELFFVRRTL